MGTVIVGAGQAGAWVAKSLRDCGYVDPVTLVGDEPHLPYERPPLSKAVFQDKGALEAARIWPPEDYASWNVELRLASSVDSIEPAERQVRLADGARLSYTHLVLATGARARRLGVKTDRFANLHYLRTREDSERLAAAVQPHTRVVVIGGGLIGLEVAAAARGRGATVTVVESADRLLGRVIDREFGEYIAARHRASGVAIRCASTIECIVGQERATEVVLSDGSTLGCDVLVAGIGALPNHELAQAAGLAVRDGILVDEFTRTSDPAIYAAGDVARFRDPHTGTYRRLELWENAQNQAIACAHAIAGRPRAYAPVAWGWSDQFDLNLQFVGDATGGDHEVRRGQVGAHRFIRFFFRGERLAGAAGVNAGREIRAVRRMLERRVSPDPQRLADLSVRLESLIPA